MCQLMLSRPPFSFRKATISLAALVYATGCSGPSPFNEKDPAASRLKPENGGIVADPNDFSHVPVPPADGPQLVPIAMTVAVMRKPDPKAETLGYLRVGARVARSEKPIANEGCPDGWYAIRPAGFVCAGLFGLDRRPAIRREREPGVQLTQALSGRNNVPWPRRLRRN